MVSRGNHEAEESPEGDERPPTWPPSATGSEPLSGPGLETWSDATRTSSEPSILVDAAELMAERVSETISETKQVGSMAPIDELDALDAPAEESGTIPVDFVDDEMLGTDTTETLEPDFEILELRLRDGEQWEELVELYLDRLDDTTEPAARGELLQRIGRVFRDSLRDPDQAFDAFLEAFRDSPRNTELVRDTERLATETDRWQELVEAAASILGATREVADKIEACKHLARWHTHVLGDLLTADAYLVRLRELDPGCALAQLRLAKTYGDQGAFDAQREALSRALARAESGEERGEIHAALAELSETHFHDMRGATENYEAAIALGSHAVQALLALERIARAEERFVDLEDVLARLVEVAPNNAMRVDALLRLADLHERHLLKPQNAAPLLEEALALDPAHEGAEEALERCYHAMRAWYNLVRAMERRAERAKKRVKCEVLLGIAEIFESKLGDDSGAFDAYQRASVARAADARPVAEMARLSERAGDWVTAANHRARLAELEPDPRVKAQIHVSIGELLSAPERNPNRARAHFEHAVVHDPRNTEAWEALQRLAERTHDDAGAAFCLEKRVSVTEAPRVRAGLLIDLARRREAAGDDDGAKRAYEAAVEADPSNTIAAERLLAYCAARAEWAAAEPLCDRLIGVAREGNADRAFDLWRLATRIATELGRKDRALSAALGAFQLQRHDRGAQEALIAVCHRSRDDVRAIARASDALASIALEPAAPSAKALTMLGDVQRALGHDVAAMQSYRFALSVEADHPGALTGLAATCIARSDWKLASKCKERLAEKASDPEERYALLIEIAELWLHCAGDLSKAAKVFDRALAIRPTDHWLLHTLLSVYSHLERWTDVARTLRSIASLEEKGEVKAKSLFAMAQVYRDKIKDPEEAARIFDEVTAVDPSRLDAFERTVRIYTETRNWTALRDAYARMICRVRGRNSAGLLHQLHHQLGLICRDRLADADGALQAFARCRALKPEDEQGLRIVTELYVLTDQIEKAVDETRKSIAANALAPMPYHELYALHLRQHQYDKAWCAADVLSHLKACSEEQARFLNDYPPHALSQVPGCVSAAAWETHVSHPDLDLTLTAIFSLAVTAIVRARTKSMPSAERAATLGERIERGAAGLERPVMAVVRDACEIIGQPIPVFYRKKGLEPFTLGLSTSPTLVLAPDVVQTLAPGALAFLAGKRLAEQRPSLLAHGLFRSVTDLAGVLQTAVRIAKSGGRHDTGLPAFDTEVRDAMDEGELSELRHAVSTLYQPGATADVATWAHLADATTTRVGLLLAGSVEIARKSLVLEKQHPSARSPREQLKEMLAFAVSDDYADLRAALGISVEAAMRGSAA